MHELSASNKLIHSAIVEKNNELAGIKDTMEKMHTTFNRTLGTNNLYRGGDIVEYAGKNKT